MKKLLFGCFLSIGVILGNVYASDIGVERGLLKGLSGHHCQERVLEKHCGKGHRGPRGHRGHRGPRGHKGHRGHCGKQGPTGPSVCAPSARAFLPAPGEPIDILVPELSPYVVPLCGVDTAGTIPFDTVTSAFTVPESGMYQAIYCVNAASRHEALSAFPKAEDIHGVVMAILVDGMHLYGVRNLPLVVTDLAPQMVGAVSWGTHQVTIPLEAGQTVRLVIVATPTGEAPTAMQFMQYSGSSIRDEVAYLFLQKIC